MTFLIWILVIVATALAFWVVYRWIRQRSFGAQEGLAGVGVLVSAIGVLVALSDSNPAEESAGPFREAFGERLSVDEWDAYRTSRSSGDPRFKERPSEDREWSWNNVLWKPGVRLRVRFLNGTARERSHAEEIAREWAEHANVKFEFVPYGPSDIRIQFEPSGSGDRLGWSYLGNTASAVSESKPTMGLLGDADSDLFRLTVLHEFGHALGLIHEQNNPRARVPWNQEAVYHHYVAKGWSASRVKAAFLSAYDNRLMRGYRDFDPMSVMWYPMPDHIVPASLQLRRSDELSESDKAFIASLYP